MSLLSLLFFTGTAASQALATPAIVDDALIERTFRPAGIAQAKVMLHLKKSPAFQDAYKRLGDDRCDAYLKAWRKAFAKEMPSVRAAYYESFRKIHPQEKLVLFSKMPMTPEVGAILTDRVSYDVMHGSGRPHMIALGRTFFDEYVAAARLVEKAPSREQSTIAELELNIGLPDRLCRVTAETIEADQ